MSSDRTAAWTYRGFIPVPPAGGAAGSVSAGRVKEDRFHHGPASHTLHAFQSYECSGSVGSAGRLAENIISRPSS